MSITIELAPEQEHRLREKAAQHGLNVSDYLIHLAEQGLSINGESVAVSARSLSDELTGLIGTVGGGSRSSHLAESEMAGDVPLTTFSEKS